MNLAFPITEISNDGTAIITKNPLHSGFVDALNVRGQFLYEIQGTKYINPDVLADIENVKIENTGEKDRVRVSGVVGSPPPPTTKAMTVAIGGYLAEATFYMNGLDLDAKERFMRQQIEYAFRDSNFTELSIERYGSGEQNPSKQAMGTVSIRVLVKGKKKKDIAEDVFRKHIYALRMQFYAGISNPNYRQVCQNMLTRSLMHRLSYVIRLPYHVPEDVYGAVPWNNLV